MKIRIWYMRDNHTFLELPLDVELALDAMRAERDNGYTFGFLLCGHPDGVVPKPVHSDGIRQWRAFEIAARTWLEAAVSVSKVPEIDFQRDAERYRWLRGHFRFANDSLREIWFDQTLDPVDPVELDEEIDRAMSGDSVD